MATIRARKRADGTTGYTAIVRLKKAGKIIHQEAQTFSRLASAQDWARRREVELEDPAALVKATQASTRLGDLIKWYVEAFEKVQKWQRSKASHLQFLQNHSIADADAMALTPAILVDHIRSRRAGGAGPATAGNDLTWIGVVLDAAKGAKGLQVPVYVVEEARMTCRTLKLIGKSRRRDRRPTADELKRLAEFFERRDKRAEIPMADIMWFAVYSARREAEICRLERKDNHKKDRTGIVRDAKHPRAKDGNHRTFKYTPEAWAIMERQPVVEGEDRIFPFNPKSVCAAFTRACAILGIVDLHFHDLRHEATSRLFERGYDIPEVALFTLHESWQELKRYTNLRPGQVRDLPAAKGKR